MVCRSCSRNRYPLKYLKDRMAKVCDHCYAELRKRGMWNQPKGYNTVIISLIMLCNCLCLCVHVGGNIPGTCGSASPRTQRASRPLSAVFQSLQPPSLWRNKKSTSPLTQVHTHTYFPLVPFLVLLTYSPLTCVNYFKVDIWLKP